MKLYYIDKPELDKITEHCVIREPGIMRNEINMEVLLDSLRLNVLYMVQQAGSGHLGGSLSSLTIMVPLFFGGMDPDDVFISSKGHDAPALYACLTAKGVIPFDAIHTFRRPGGLPGHPTVDVPGVMFNTGSLGMGISKANGLAAADRLAGRERKIHVLIGDGELQEGQNWEAFHFLDDNVIVHIDCNGYQLATKTQNTIMVPMWDENLIQHHTLKGSGISFMENDNKYHAGALSDDEYLRASAEICGRLSESYGLDRIAMLQTEKQPYPRPCPVHVLAKEYPEIIATIGENPRVVCLDADLEPDVGLTEFHELYPDRFIQCGIAEQDMVSMATGLAAGGFIPIVHSFAAFLCRRANEQIYNACLERRHIVFVGAMAGMLPVGPGTSHECMEDVGLMKTMPGMTILQPETPDQLWAAMEWAVNEATGPVYVSILCWEMEGMRR